MAALREGARTSAHLEKIIPTYTYGAKSFLFYPHTIWPWPYLHSLSVWLPESIRVLCGGAVSAWEE